MATLLNSLNMVAKLPVPVLLCGKAGVGKTMLARYLVTRSNCQVAYSFCAKTAQLSSPLSGQISRCKTIDQALLKATGHSLIIDKFDKLSAYNQAILESYLDNYALKEQGANSGKTALAGAVYPQVRIIATTTLDVANIANLQQVSLSCWSKLANLHWQVPSLSQRQADILQLLRIFCLSAANELGLQPLRFSAASVKRLKNYNWHYNVAELKQLCWSLTTAYALSKQSFIVQPQHLGQKYKQLGDESLDLLSLEVNAIRTALERAAGNKTGAARLLGLSRDALNYRLKKYNLF